MPERTTYLAASLIFAISASLAWSAPASPGWHATLTSRKPAFSSTAQRMLEGKLAPPTYRALIIGINEYRDWTELDWPRNAAAQIADTLKHHYGFQDVRLLSDGKATRQAILDELDRLATELGPHDALLIYFGGHGYTTGRGHQAYWIPSDGAWNVSAANAERQWIASSLVKGRLAGLRARQVLVISDSCFSSSAVRRDREPPPDGQVAAPLPPTAQPAWWCLASGYEEDVPIESQFSRRLINLLQAPPQGAFTPMDLADWIRETIPPSPDQETVAGPMSSSAVPGNEFVFLRNEVRVTPLPAGPLDASPPSSTATATAERPGQPRLDARLPSEGVSDQEPVDPRNSEIDRLSERQRSEHRRIDWEEQRVVVEKLRGQTGGAAAPEEASPLIAMDMDTRTLSVLAHQQFARGNLAEAAAAFARILEKDPRHLAAMSNLGVIRYIQEQFDDAVRIFQNALGLEPDDDFCLTMLGMILTKQKKADEAIRVLTRASSLKPNDPTLQNYLGIVWGQKGDHTAAEKHLLKAVLLKPDYAEAHYNLALLYLSQVPRSVELARIHYKAARKLNLPPDPDVESLLNK